MTATIRGRGGARRTVRLAARRPGGASAIRSLKLKARGAQVTATARVALPAGAGPASATLTWQARRGGRTVRKGAIALTPAQVEALGRGVPFRVAAPKGRYALRASLVVGAVRAGQVLPTVSARKASTRVTI